MRWAALGVVLVLLGGCARAATEQPAPSDARLGSAAQRAPYNAADVGFLQTMVGHHGQGGTLVRLAKGRAVREDVQLLAAAIDVTQADEVATMERWLREWGLAEAAGHSTHRAVHGHVHDITASDLATLRGERGDGFERDFLNLLIAHQHNAADLARAHAKAGVHPDVLDLARRIDQSRTEQIKLMLGYLGGQAASG